MFGTPDVDEILAGDNGHKGDQIRGFGFLHDGSVDTIFRFYRGKVFDCALGNLVGFCGGDNQRRDAEQFMLAFDSDLPPVVGQQITMTNTSRTDTNVNNRVNLLEARCRDLRVGDSGSGARECDLVAKAVSRRRHDLALISSGSNAGQYSRTTPPPRRTSTYVRDRASTAGQPVTWTAVPYGSGTRIEGDLSRIATQKTRRAVSDAARRGRSPGDSELSFRGIVLCE